MDNALSFDGLPIASLGHCRPFVGSDPTGRVLLDPRFQRFDAAPARFPSGSFFQEMSWKLVNDALLA
jgi:hypothetical protein